MQVNRIEPRLPVQAYKTFEIRSPLATHWRPATCEEVNCPAFLHGWRVRVEGLDPQLLHIARNSGRSYRELPVGEGETWLVFEAGQSCFRAASHRIQVGRPEIYLSRGGDWRGATTEPRQHSGPDPWLDEFQTNQDRIATVQNRG